MTTRKGMFAVFADEDEDQTTTTTAKAAPKKPVQAKPAAKPQEAKQEERPKQARREDVATEGFEAVGQESARGGRGGRGGFRGGERGGFRGGRGGNREGGERREGGEGGFRGERGGFRGGRGGRGGERRPRVEGEEPREPREFRPRTEGGRGRGDRRPRTEGGAPVEGGDEGVLYVQRKEKVDFEGKTHHFEGKRREQWHPYDRKDGTGRGRGFAKGGHGKGNWGTRDEEAKAGEETTPAAEGTTPAATEEVAEGEKVEDATEKVEAPVEEEFKRPSTPTEDDKNASKLTYEEYMAKKKRSTLKKEARGHEEVKRTGLQAAEPKKEKVQGLNSQLKDQEVYNVAVGKNELANLLSFQGQEDDFYVSERRPARGGFRGGRGGRGGPRPEGGQRGGRQQQLRMDENAFPSLE